MLSLWPSDAGCIRTCTRHCLPPKLFQVSGVSSALDTRSRYSIVPQDCGDVVAAKFFPIDGPDGKQQPLCERDYFRRLNLICAKCGLALRGSYITACSQSSLPHSFLLPLTTTQTKSTTWNTLRAPHVRLFLVPRIRTTNMMVMCTVTSITRRGLPRNARVAAVRS